MTRDRIFGLFFLAFSIAYGVLAQDIELYFGAEDESFTARTFPTALAFAGAFVALLMIALSSRSPEASEGAAKEAAPARFHWPPVLILCAVMVLYGLTIKTVGFLVSTTCFLAIGYVLLGERRWWLVAAASLPVAAAFQFILHGLLGIYITDPLLQALGLIT